MHNPFAGYPITDDWNDHISRGSAGGVDWAMPVGTPVYAPEAGYVSFIPYNGTGGHTATLIRDSNHSTQFMHLSQFAGGPRNVAEGELLGLSGGAKGADGAGSSTGPHCHAHSYEFGKRVPPFFMFAAAGSSGKPLTDPEEDPMKRLIYKQGPQFVFRFGFVQHLKTPAEVNRWVGQYPELGSPINGGDEELVTLMLTNGLAQFTMGQVLALATEGGGHFLYAGPSAAAQIDVAALGAAIAKALPTVTDDELAAAKREIIAAIPTAFKAVQ